MNIKPHGERLIIQTIQEATQTLGGIILPSVAQGQPCRGKVLAARPGSAFQVGQVVIFAKYAGVEIEVENEEGVFIMNERDILATVGEHEELWGERYA